MSAYADWVFHANGYDKGSRESRLTIWNRIYKRSGNKVSQLEDKPVLIPEATYLWNTYNEVAKGTERLTYRDINAYQMVSGIKLENFEVGIMFDIDLMRIKHRA